MWESGRASEHCSAPAYLQMHHTWHSKHGHHLGALGMEGSSMDSKLWSMDRKLVMDKNTPIL